MTRKFSGAGAEEHAVEADSALLSALLTGVNRAFPFVPDDDVAAIIESHTPVLFRMVRGFGFHHQGLFQTMGLRCTR